jgi:hypothetical protein
MASATFRDSMNSLGWSRREAEAPANTSQPSFLGRIQNLNPFGEGGYVRLPITETNPGAPLPAPTRREEEEGWFARKSTSSFCGKTRRPSLRVFAASSTPLSLDVIPPNTFLWLVMSSGDDALRLVSPAPPWLFVSLPVYVSSYGIL